MANAFSREAVADFIDYESNKGLINKATASARKAAVKRVFAILEAHEAQDVTKIDLDEVMHRFSNLEGAAFTPESLSTYRSRVRTALDDFVSWKQDPIGFRPRGSIGTRKAKPLKGEGNKFTTASVADPAPAIATTNLSQTHSLPIPLRPDLTVFVHGVPFDLSKAEARRIANVVLAMAMETEA